MRFQMPRPFLGGNMKKTLVLIAFLLFAFCSGCAMEKPADESSTTLSQESDTVSSVSEKEEADLRGPYDRIDPSYAFRALPEEGKAGESDEKYSASACFVNANGTDHTDLYCFRLSAADNSSPETGSGFGGLHIRPVLYEAYQALGFAGKMVCDEGEFAYLYRYLAGNTYRVLTEEEKADGSVYPTAAFCFAYDDGETDGFLLASDYRVLHMQLDEYPLQISKPEEGDEIPEEYSYDMWIAEKSDCDAISTEKLPEEVWLHLYVLAVRYMDSGLLPAAFPMTQTISGNSSVRLSLNGKEKILSGTEAMTQVLSVFRPEITAESASFNNTFPSIYEGTAGTELPEGTITLWFSGEEFGGFSDTPVYLCPDGSLIYEPAGFTFQAFGLNEGFSIRGLVKITAAKRFSYGDLAEVLEEN